MREQGFAGCNVTIPAQGGGLRRRGRRHAGGARRGGGQHAVVRGRPAGRRQHRRGRLHEPSCAPPSRLRSRGDAPVAVLGAGGAARGIVYAFLEAGAPEVRIFNRTRERADAVARHFGPRVKAYDWRDRVERSREAACWSTPPRSAWSTSAPLDMPLAQLDDGLRRRRSGLRAAGHAAAGGRARARPRRRRRSRHAAAPGRARLREMVRRAPEVTDELRALLVADIEGH